MINPNTALSQSFCRDWETDGLADAVRPLVMRSIMTSLSMFIMTVAIKTVSAAEYDLIVVGGGMAGLMTARAASELYRMRVLVVEQGTICGQGATAAAKQGHVYVPSGSMQVDMSTLSLSNRLRAASLRIYREMTAAGYDVGLLEAGHANILTGTLSGWDLAGWEMWAGFVFLRLSNLSPRLIDSSELAAQNLTGRGALWNAGSAMVTPCRALAAARSYVESRGSVVREGAAITGATHNGTHHAVTLADGTVERARALVLALGTYHDAFVATHLSVCAASSPRVGGVAGQIAIYEVPALPPSPGVFVYSPGSAIPMTFPSFQSRHLSKCPWVPSYV